MAKKIADMVKKPDEYHHKLDTIAFLGADSDTNRTTNRNAVGQTR